MRGEERRKAFGHPDGWSLDISHDTSVILPRRCRNLTMAEDAFACFQDLLKNVPGWIVDLESIVDNATRKQNELLFANQPTVSEKILVRKASKSSSLFSRHSKKDEVAGSRKDEIEVQDVKAREETPVPTLLRPQLPHLSNSDALRLSQRKRKTTSAMSGQQSGPSKFRSKGLVVIYYDGGVQKQFEALVKTISLCRNGIRKAKMNYKIDNLARSGSSSSESGGSGGEETIKGLGTFTYKTTRKTWQEPSSSKEDGTAAFDKVDGLLEKTQALCEQAAHQVLRDGDCTPELAKAKDHLTNVKIAAKAELPVLEKKADKAAERHRRSEEERRVAEEERQKQKATQADSEKIELLSVFPSDGHLEVDNSECDDDDSEGELDFGALQMPPSLSKYGMRSGRLAAH